jgi:hypothetical protein
MHRSTCRPTTACSAAGRDKLLGRGRSGEVLGKVMRARVLERVCTRADAERWATGALNLRFAFGMVQFGHEASPPV